MSAEIHERSTTRRWIRRGIVGLALVAVAMLGIYLARAPLLILVGHQLVHEDMLEEADAIVVLGGGQLWHELAAADLYSLGLAPVVVITKVPENSIVEEMTRRGLPFTSTTEARIAFLEQAGVPVDAVTVLSRHVQSIQQEADLFAEWAALRDIRRLIIVTSVYQSARVRFVFDRTFDEGTVVHVHPAQIEQFDHEQWWRERTTLREGLLELQKLLYDRLIYSLGRFARPRTSSLWTSVSNGAGRLPWLHLCALGRPTP